MSADGEVGPQEMPLDFGSGVTGKILVNSKDEEIGLIEMHQNKAGEPCFGSVRWRRAEGEPGPVWTLVQREPLTLSPSILCRICEHHGFIRDGKWVNA